MIKYLFLLSFLIQFGLANAHEYRHEEMNKVSILNCDKFDVKTDFEVKKNKMMFV